MNIEKIAAKTGIDLQTLLKYIDMFIDQTEADLADIQTAMADKKWVNVIKSAHSIKGAALSLELEGIAAAAKELESSARDKKTELIPAVVDSLNRLVGELKKTLPGV